MSDQSPDLSTLLAECEKKYQKMTPGPYYRDGKLVKHEYNEHVPRRPPVANCDLTHGLGQAHFDDLANAEGIVTLVNAYPALRDEIVRLREALRETTQTIERAQKHLWTRHACDLLNLDSDSGLDKARAALTDAPAPQETTE